MLKWMTHLNVGRNNGKTAAVTSWGLGDEGGRGFMMRLWGWQLEAVEIFFLFIIIIIIIFLFFFFFFFFLSVLLLEFFFFFFFFFLLKVVDFFFFIVHVPFSEMRFIEDCVILCVCVCVCVCHFWK